MFSIIIDPNIKTAWDEQLEMNKEFWLLKCIEWTDMVLRSWFTFHTLSTANLFLLLLLYVITV